MERSWGDDSPKPRADQENIIAAIMRSYADTTCPQNLASLSPCFTRRILKGGGWGVYICGSLPPPPSLLHPYLSATISVHIIRKTCITQKVKKIRTLGPDLAFLIIDRVIPPGRTTPSLAYRAVPRSHSDTRCPCPAPECLERPAACEARGWQTPGHFRTDHGP